jgi:uncharacterized oligopeptide transporter (OPT) family protein
MSPDQTKATEAPGKTHPNNESFELPVGGFTGTPEEIEAQWLEKVYKGRGDTMPQFTLRAVVMGSVLGGVLSLTNLYIGLKSGWGFGVAITACILSYAIWTTFYQLGFAKTPMTILENNCMQSTASAAGYSTGTTLVSAFSAFILITGNPLPVGLTLAWVFFLAVLGVTMAIPMKRQMINVEQLRFPSGLAAAETLRALHSHGKKGMRAAKALGIAGGLAAISQFWTDGLRLISSSLESLQLDALVTKANGALFGKAWMGRTVMFAWDPIFIAAGAITGMRVCLSMLISGTLCWAVYLPIMQSQGSTWMFASVDFKDEAASAALTAKLQAGADPLSSYLWNQFSEPSRRTLLQTNLAASTRTAALAKELDHLLTGPSLYDPSRFASFKISPETLSLATSTTKPGTLIRHNRQLLQEAYPEIASTTGFRGLVQWSLWGGTSCMVASGLLTFLLQWKTSIRAFQNLGKMFRRGTSKKDPLEDIEAPTSWFLIGQVVSLVVLAYLAKRTFDMPYWLAGLALVMSFVLALVACRVTGETDTTPVGAMGQITQLTIGAIHPGSATTTLMSANVVSSAAISSADLLTDLKSGYLLGANPRKQFLAQFSGIFIGTLITVLSFRVMVPNASVLGSDRFPAPAAQNWRAVAIAMSKGIADLHPVKKWSIGIGVGVGIALALLPAMFPKKIKWMPSAAGVGLAWTFHWYYSLLFFIGALGAYVWQKRNAASSEEFVYPVASGVIAGGSLMGVFLIFWENGGELIQVLRSLFPH